MKNKKMVINQDTAACLPVVMMIKRDTVNM